MAKKKKSLKLAECPKIQYYTANTIESGSFTRVYPSDHSISCLSWVADPKVQPINILPTRGVGLPASNTEQHDDGRLHHGNNRIKYYVPSSTECRCSSPASHNEGHANLNVLCQQKTTGLSGVDCTAFRLHFHEKALLIV